MAPGARWPTLAGLVPICSREHFSRFDPKSLTLAARTPPWLGLVGAGGHSSSGEKSRGTPTTSSKFIDRHCKLLQTCKLGCRTCASSSWLCEGLRCREVGTLSHRSPAPTSQPAPPAACLSASRPLISAHHTSCKSSAPSTYTPSAAPTRTQKLCMGPSALIGTLALEALN